MIRYRYKKAKLLFVGINPHHGSDARGVPFSNNKLFWYLLADAGLLKEDRQNLRSNADLRNMYERRFNAIYRLGFVNLIDRPTRDITELSKGEETTGKKRTVRIIKAEKPSVVCFVGKISYQKFTGLKQFDFGWQSDIFGSKAYVMHFPLRGEASIRIRELRTVGKAAGLI